MTAAAQALPKTHLAALQNLIAVEGEALDAKDLTALRHIAVNRPRSLLKMGHIIWVSRRGGGAALEAMSSQVTLDKTTPFAQWMKQQLRKRLSKPDSRKIVRWDFDAPAQDSSFTYPFRFALYAPLSPDPRLGGLLFTRDYEFTDSELPLLIRLSKIFGTSAMALTRKARPRLNLNRRVGLSGALALFIAAAFIPVPMTSLAPAEIIAHEPYYVTAPFDGVIETLFIPPNSAVTSGTPLVRFIDTAYRNDVILAEQEQALAEAKLREAALLSHIKSADKPDIAVAKAEKALAISRKNYAQTRLSKTVLTAPKSGLAIYTSEAEWTGRHVNTGEAIIEIADPAKIQLRLEAPLTIGESLKTGSRLKLFLDSDPLNPIEAQLSAADYYAKTLPNGQMAYEAFAAITPSGGQSLPRIGTRGIAKIYGPSAPLGYWIFRRPLTMLRQNFGF